MKFVLMTFFLLSTTLCFAESGSTDLFLKRKENALQAIKKLQVHVNNNFTGARPDNTFPPFIVTREKSDSCRFKAITDNDLVGSLKGGQEPQFELEGNCKLGDNPFGDVRSFNCLQFGRWQARALVYIQDYLSYGKSFKVEKFFGEKGSKKLLNDYLISFPIKSINNHCMENLGRFNVNIGFSFNELLAEFKSYKINLNEIVKEVEEYQE